jgi:hypothetical protein
MPAELPGQSVASRHAVGSSVKQQISPAPVQLSSLAQSCPTVLPPASSGAPASPPDAPVSMVEPPSVLLAPPSLLLAESTPTPPASLGGAPSSLHPISAAMSIVLTRPVRPRCAMYQGYHLVDRRLIARRDRSRLRAGGIR